MDGAVRFIYLAATVSGVTLVSSHQACYNGSKYDVNSNNPHRWVLPYEDPCEYAAVLGGLTAPNVSYQQGAPYYLNKIAVRMLEFFGCQDDRKSIECSTPEPLGLEDRTIPDESISVSSSYFAWSGRLNGVAWVPRFDANCWLEVDLGESTVVSGLITQGDETIENWRVTEYKVKYKKMSSSDYEDVKDNNGAIQVFEGNIEDNETPVTNMFDQSIMAVIVRIEPVAFIDLVSLRLELLGCHIN
ncbi:lactadherin-like [Asterias rubens]|uniref:lactadherin-like n=1 Tax=Asterias rubens TaxID=7604 RepID=UPI0014550CB9|nr:lactadherin-like [Asterias rubens]